MFIVCIDHLTEAQLNFYGWALVRETDEFWLYLHIHTGEERVVDKAGKKFLIIDSEPDYADVHAPVHASDERVFKEDR